MITVNSYFSGAGLFDIGMSAGGLTIQQSFEIDRVCCETLRKNFGHEVIESDISKKLVFDDEECDVMVGTFPCTKYSTAADIHGTRTGDDLFLHFFRHLALRRPEVYVVENVPGMRKFPVVMEALSRMPDYYATVFCPIKADSWLPQKRDRLILIGSKRPFLWREPAPGRPVSLSEIMEDAADMEIPASVMARIRGKYRDRPIISDPQKGDKAPTCVAHYAKDRGTRLIKDDKHPAGVRPYTPREYARLQGVPDSYQFAGTPNQIYRQVGNGVAVPVGTWVARELRRYFE